MIPRLALSAAVVGLLISALYSPVIQSGIRSDLDVALALAGFVALRVFGINIALLVAAFALAGTAMHVLI